MRAAVITLAGVAPAHAEHPDPAPAPGRTVVRVEAAPIAPLDLLAASGTSYFGVPATPYVPGVQGVGRTPDGTPVWFSTDAGMRPGDGSLAELCSVADGDLVPLPDGVTPVQAAALGLSAVAAWVILTDSARLAAGERVLVLGAGGIVGQVAVQAARVLGASRVVGAARSAAARARADDDEPAALAARLRDALGGEADVVVDPLCGVPGTAGALALAPGGRLVNLGSEAGPTLAVDSASIRARHAAVLGYTNNALSPAQRRTALEAVLGHAAAGRIIVGHHECPLDDVTAAWERQAARSGTRQVVRIAAGR
ncbi:quinone oxidoreductase family protein [Xylanimonas sp. McL0601]|uniref:quinone oxidoreductase family protein n=1 Tax=Xylanimonas sp. McL0601 TaxID=3414739 RepID=UPI003CEAAF69